MNHALQYHGLLYLLHSKMILITQGKLKKVGHPVQVVF